MIIVPVNVFHLIHVDIDGDGLFGILLNLRQEVYRHDIERIDSRLVWAFLRLHPQEDRVAYGQHILIISPVFLEEHKLSLTVKVLYRHLTHRVALARQHRPDIGHNAAYGEHVAM